MSTAAWWVVGATVFVMSAAALLVRFRVGPPRWISDALARQREAEMRAEALLLNWLSPRQREQYRSHGWFDVVTPGGNRYRIRAGRVVRLEARRCVYCIEASAWVPVADELLAKKLLLETDEQRFLATAHRYR